MIKITYAETSHSIAGTLVVLKYLEKKMYKNIQMREQL
jgi:hypothetical protein